MSSIYVETECAVRTAARIFQVALGGGTPPGKGGSAAEANLATALSLVKRNSWERLMTLEASSLALIEAASSRIFKASHP
jgi:hypothetical protein